MGITPANYSIFGWFLGSWGDGGMCCLLRMVTAEHLLKSTVPNVGPLRCETEKSQRFCCFVFYVDPGRNSKALTILRDFSKAGKTNKQTLGNRKWCIDKYEHLYGPTLDLIRLQKWLVGIWPNLLLFWFHCSYTLSIYVLSACAMNAYKVEERFVCSWTIACRKLPVRNMSLHNLPSCPHVDGAVGTI